MKDISLILKNKPTIIALTVKAIQDCLSTRTKGKFRVLPEFGPGGGAQRKYNTRNIHPTVNTTCPDVCHSLKEDFLSHSREVLAKKIDTICSMIHRRIHSTGMEPVMAQAHNDQGSFDQNFLDYVPTELVEQADNSLNCLCNFVAGTEAWMRLSAVLSLGVSAIASSSQPIPCSNCNGNDITNITSIENTWLVDASTTVNGAMPLGGDQWCL